MTVHQFLTNNHEVVNQLTKCGVLSLTTPLHYAAYSRFKFFKEKGMPITECYLNVGDEFHLSENMIYRIRKRMEAEL